MEEEEEVSLEGSALPNLPTTACAMQLWNPPPKQPSTPINPKTTSKQKRKGKGREEEQRKKESQTKKKDQKKETNGWDISGPRRERLYIKPACVC